MTKAEQEDFSRRRQMWEGSERGRARARAIKFRESRRDVLSVVAMPRGVGDEGGGGGGGGRGGRRTVCSTTVPPLVRLVLSLSHKSVSSLEVRLLLFGVICSGDEVVVDLFPLRHHATDCRARSLPRPLWEGGEGTAAAAPAARVSSCGERTDGRTRSVGRTDGGHGRTDGPLL